MKRLIRSFVLLACLLTVAPLSAQVNGWFPRISPNAEHVVSGAGELWLDAQPLLANGSIVVGWNPAWLDDETFVFNGGPGVGLRKFNLVTNEAIDVDPRELIELAAGGDVWAGRHAPSNTLVVSDGREIIGAGQPWVAPDGAVIYRGGDDKIEPFISLTAEAWGDGRGRILGGLRGGPIADRTVGDFEARALLIDTPEGPFVLAMTRTSFHLRPLLSDQGYEPPSALVGENRNLNADARYVNGSIVAVWQDDRGQLMHWRQSLAEPRKALGVSTPEPPIVTPAPPIVTPPAPEGPQVDDARAKTIVERERAKFGPMSAEQVAQFLRNVALALNAEGVAGGPFGVLRKTTGANCAGYSCDIICVGNGDAQRQWDVLSDADPGGRQEPGWSGPLPEIAVRECEVPAGPIVTPPTPSPEPPSDDTAALTARIAELEAQVETLHAQTHALAEERDAALERMRFAEQESAAARMEVKSLEKQLTTVTCTASIFGIKIPCKVNR